LGSICKMLCEISCEDQAKPLFSPGSAEASKKEPRFGPEASETYA
jgi:hypothetical protein